MLLRVKGYKEALKQYAVFSDSSIMEHSIFFVLFSTFFCASHSIPIENGTSEEPEPWHYSNVTTYQNQQFYWAKDLTFSASVSAGINFDPLSFIEYLERKAERAKQRASFTKMVQNELHYNVLDGTE